MPKLTIQTTITHEVLEDGLWHPYAEVIYQVSRRIPPNIAVHKIEVQRKRSHEQHHGKGSPLPPRIIHTDYEQQVLFGARYIARTVLMNNPRIEHAKTPDGKHYVRLRTAMVEPPESDIGEWEQFLPRPAKGVPYCQRPVAEQQQLLDDRIKRMRDTNLRARGIDPDTFVTDWPERKKAQEVYRAMTPEEKKEFNRQASLKGWEKRRAIKEQEQADGKVPPGD